MLPSYSVSCAQVLPLRQACAFSNDAPLGRGWTCDEGTECTFQLSCRQVDQRTYHEPKWRGAYPSVRRAGVLSHVCRSRVGAGGVTESERPTGCCEASTYPFTGRTGALFHACCSGVGEELRPVVVEL